MKFIHPRSKIIKSRHDFFLLGNEENSCLQKKSYQKFQQNPTNFRRPRPQSLENNTMLIFLNGYKTVINIRRNFLVHVAWFNCVKILSSRKQHSETSFHHTENNVCVLVWFFLCLVHVFWIISSLGTSELTYGLLLLHFFFRKPNFEFISFSNDEKCLVIPDTVSIKTHIDFLFLVNE